MPMMYCTNLFALVDIMYSEGMRYRVYFWSPLQFDSDYEEFKQSIGWPKTTTTDVCGFLVRETTLCKCNSGGLFPACRYLTINH